MPRNPFDIGYNIAGTILGSDPKKKKRKTLTPAQRTFFWEHPKLCSKVCSICHEKITKASDMELDHTRAYSKGGTTLAFAHRDCNRIKASGSLGKAQKLLGIKTKSKTTVQKKKTTKQRTVNPWGIQPIKMPKLKF